MTNDLLYPVVIQPLSEEDGGGYMAYAIDLKGCKSDGETPEEAIVNLKDAVGEWIHEAKRLGRTVPQPGEGAVKAHQERMALLNLLKKQEEMIQKQLPGLSKDIAELKEQIAMVSRLIMERMERDDCDNFPLGMSTPAYLASMRIAAH